MITNRFYLFFFLILFLSPFASAVGISPAMLDVNFKPGEVLTFDFMAIGTNIETYVIYPNAELNNSIILSDFKKSGNRLYFKATLTLPDKISNPGTNTILIGAKDVSPEEGMLSTIAAVQTPIYVKVPYPGQYIGISLDAPNVKMNEPVNFKINCENLGDDAVNVDGRVEVYDSGGLVASIDAGQKTIGKTEKAVLSSVWNSAGYKEGNYAAKAIVTYADKSAEDEKIFRIGALKVNILNYTNEAQADFRNNLKIEVESVWNEKIPDVFASIDIFNGSGKIDSFKTVNFDLNPWEIKNASAWWDTKGIGLGEYDANITVYYAGKSNSIEGKINVVPKAQESSIPWAIILPLAVIFVIIINIIIWLMALKKR